MDDVTEQMFVEVLVTDLTIETFEESVLLAVFLTGYCLCPHEDRASQYWL
ncbi:hypothetical protein AOR01nite_06310 [Acetobacter orleanensis]|uniref:Uncharacterized protein n=1 Tax=Acetobacter orleanensis TaxID=104099 RepID=A0A4Y3TK81_9PROT|nr:hypothetical protein Abol_030_086 [Acetobacter orleanensis JCM 7639]GEB82154.1 hypothetical protein AOR01nite_06310 [Acetobacter orleanensis]